MPDPDDRPRAGAASAVLGAALALGMVLAGPATATSSGPEPSATVGACLAAGEVWLHVRTETGAVLRSECVGTPATGRAALDAAEVAVRLDRSGYICSIAGHPERCPASFAGQYWQYGHAASIDDPWRHAQRGADGRRPPPGSIEGWCYNARDEDRCDLPALAASDPAAARVDLTAEPAAVNVGAIVAVGLFLAAVALYVRGQRRS